MKRIASAEPAGPEFGFPAFDWLRLVLASIVVLGHAGLPIWDMAGNFSVNVFFALSGWLIGGILLRTEASGLPRFYFNRSLRIWTPYLAAVAFLYVTAAFFEQTGPIWYQFLFYDLTFTHYWFIPKIPEVISQMPLQGTGAVFWSISVEEQFYVLAPLILLFLPYGRRAVTWLLIAVCVGTFDYHYCSISCGVLAAILRDRYGVWYGGWIIRVSIAVIAALAAWACYQNDTMYAWFVPIASVCIVLATSVEGPRTSLGRFFGGVSYPLYLNHWVGLFAASAINQMFGLPSVLHVLLAYFLAVVASSVAYLAIDVQVLRVRKAHYKPRAGRILMISAYSLLGIGIVGGLLFLPRLGHGRP